MLPHGVAHNSHVFSHQQQYQGGPSWLEQQQQNAQHAAAQAANAQLYNRMAVNHNASSGPSSIATHGQESTMMENVSEENRRTLNFIADLLNEETREAALLELSKKREQVPELALILWHSFGVMTSLLGEIISVYTLLNPSQLTAAASNRVCNALALLQCVASHNETRALFLNGKSILQCYFWCLANQFSAYPTVPLSFPQHHVEVQTFRIFTLDLPRRYWGPCEE